MVLSPHVINGKLRPLYILPLYDDRLGFKP